MLSKGKSITRATTNEGEVPVIGGGLGPTYYHNIANRKPPVITISASGANAGFVNYWDLPIWASDCTTIVEKSDSPASLDYIYKYLQSRQEFINTELRRGSAQPHVYPTDIAELEIPLPSLGKQREIVEKLESAFAEIDLLERNLEQSNEKTNELQNSLLSNFLTSTDADSELTHSTTSQRLTSRIGKLSEACSFSRGLTYGKADEVEYSNNVVLRANNIDLETNSLILEDLRYIKDSIKIKPEKIARKNSLIICTASGSKSHVGKVALINEDYGYAFGGFMGQLTPSNECDPKFLYYILTSGSFKDFLMTLNDGTNINNLKFSDIENYEIPLLPLEKQYKIVEKLDKAIEQIESLRFQIKLEKENAASLRKSLLSSAFAQEKVVA